MTLALKVECYSGYKVEERPRRFTALAPRARTYEVMDVLDQWYGPGYQCFKVRADDGNLYILKRHLTEDAWSLESFRQDK